MEFQDDLYIQDYMYDSSDSDKFFGRGEDEDEGFCDSDDNASNGHPAVEEVKKESSSKKQQEDDAGYADFDKFLLHSAPNNILDVLQADPNNQQIPSGRHFEELPSLFEGDLLSVSQASYVDMPAWNHQPVEQNTGVLDKPDAIPPCSLALQDLYHLQPYGYASAPSTTANSSSNNNPASPDILGAGRWQDMGPSSRSTDTASLFGTTSSISSALYTATAPMGSTHHHLSSQPRLHSSASSTSLSSTLKSGGEPSPIPGYTEDELVSLPYNEFKTVLKRLQIGNDDTSKAKEVRKRGKNRAAAQNCRKNKVRAISSLEVEVQDLRQQLSKCSHERDILLRELQVIKGRCNVLQYQSNGGQFAGKHL